MPVHGCRLRQMVVDDDPYAVALSDLNGWPWRAAVITPDVDGLVRHNLSLYRLGNQMKDLCAVVHRKRQVRDIGRFDTRVPEFVPPEQAWTPKTIPAPSPNALRKKLRLFFISVFLHRTTTKLGTLVPKSCSGCKEIECGVRKICPGGDPRSSDCGQSLAKLSGQTQAGQPIRRYRRQSDDRQFGKIRTGFNAGQIRYGGSGIPNVPSLEERR